MFDIIKIINRLKIIKYSYINYFNQNKSKYKFKCFKFFHMYFLFVKLIHNTFILRRSGRIKFEF